MSVEIKTQIEITIGNQKISLTRFEAKRLLKALNEELEAPQNNSGVFTRDVVPTPDHKRWTMPNNPWQYPHVVGQSSVGSGGMMSCTAADDKAAY